MREVSNAIDIAASPERVWRVVTNFSDYRRWNPFIRGIKTAGRLETGSKLALRTRLSPGGRAQIFSAMALKVVPAAELRWRRTRWLRGLFDGEHALIIVPHGLNGCRLIQRERFSGLLAPLLFPLVQEKTRSALEAMNRALQRVAEARG